MSKLIRLSGLQMRELAIPRVSIREPYSINQDSAFIDARALRRYKRRYCAFMSRCAVDYLAYVNGRTPWP